MAPAEPTTPTRILIVDDHPIVIEGCRAMLAAEMDCVLSAAADAEAGEAIAEAERSDVCVVDLNLPGLTGFELCRRLLARDPTARVIVFSMNDDPVFAARAIELGAVGYVSKTGDPAELAAAIRVVLAGGVHLPHRIARSLAFANKPGAGHPLGRLTPRETEILRHVGQGKTLGEIAPLVGASYKTVANSCSAIKRKLGARTSADLVRLAVENRLAVS